MINLNIKHFFLLLIIALFSLTSLQKKRNKKCKDCATAYTFQIFIKNKYCGGARPTKEILDEMNKTEILQNRTVYVFSDENEKSNLVQKVETNAEGICTVKLKKGKYCIGLNAENNCRNPYANNYESIINYSFESKDLQAKANNEVVIQKGCGKLKLE